MKKLILFLLVLTQSGLAFAGHEGVGNVARKPSVKGGVGNVVASPEGVGNVVSAPMFLAAVDVRGPVPFIQYRRGLKLQRVSQVETTIDNSTLTKSNERVSAIFFELLNKKNVAYSAVDNVEKLKGLLPSGKSWKPVSLKGANGFVNEQRSEAQLKAEYFLLTNNGDVIHIGVKAYASADGLGLIAPIVNTFTYDAQSPVVHEIKVSPGIPGARAFPPRLWIRVTDDLSGIDPEGIRAAFAHTQSKNAYLDSEHFDDMGGGWYSAPILVNTPVRGGRYYLMKLDVLDKAMNMLSLDAGVYDPDHYEDQFHPYVVDQHKLPVVYADIDTFGNPDFKPVVVHEIKMDTKPFQAGTTREVLIRATINSRNARNEPCCITYAAMTVAASHPDFASGQTGYLKNLGNDWYQLMVRIPREAAAEPYVLTEISFSDYEGHTSKIEIDRNAGFYTGDVDDQKIRWKVIQVKEDPMAHRPLPVLKDIRMPDTIRAGEQAFMYVLANSKAGISTAQSPVIMFEPSFKTGGTPMFGADFDSVGADGWVRYILKPGAYLPPGEYFMAIFGVADNNGNALYLHTADMNAKTYLRTQQEGLIPFQQEFPTDIAVVRVKVVR